MGIASDYTAHNDSLESLIKRYGGNIPRYTSYPPATQLSAEITADNYLNWLQSLSEDDPLSLYIHVPFCDELCKFCACNTLVMRQVQARHSYAAHLQEEIRRIAVILGKKRMLTHLQWGGGTPTALPPESFLAVMETVREHFIIHKDAELAIELDPRHFPDAYLSVLRTANITRASLGVQDLDPKVQEACGRIQSWEQTDYCVKSLRDIGIGSVNIDLIYGLPYQTEASIQATSKAVAALNPDRLAVFGYAHVPWKQKRQKLLPEEALPNSLERLKQREMIDKTLKENGYKAIGLDHYARPEDRMSIAAEKGNLHRNFQGYTVDPAPALIGIGASAVSSLPQGMVQNIHAPAQYSKHMLGAGLPVARGVQRSYEDNLRGFIIERIMCDLAIDLAQICSIYDTDIEKFAFAMDKLNRFAEDGLVCISEYSFTVTEKGRPFLRNIAALFDTYIRPENQCHSQAL